jgi:hypothetical protein
MSSFAKLISPSWLETFSNAARMAAKTEAKNHEQAANPNSINLGRRMHSGNFVCRLECAWRSRTTKPTGEIGHS